MHITAERRLDDGTVEREFTIDDFDGYLWTPPRESAPLILLGHPGGLRNMYPRLTARAQHYATEFGFASASIELPGSGQRPTIATLEKARADLRECIASDEPVNETIKRALIVPLVERAVPELQTTLDRLLALPGMGASVGYEGGVTAIGIRLAVEEPRIRAANLFAGSMLPETVFTEARAVRIPLQVLLQWDDEGNDRQAALHLFDSFESPEKTLHANLGGHRGVPAFEIDAGARFFARHLS